MTSPSIAARCTLAGGDMFRMAPAGGDAYPMKYILHNWDDEHCVEEGAHEGGVRDAVQG